MPVIAIMAPRGAAAHGLRIEPPQDGDGDRDEKKENRRRGQPRYLGPAVEAALPERPDDGQRKDDEVEPEAEHAAAEAGSSAEATRPRPATR